MNTMILLINLLIIAIIGLVVYFIYLGQADEDVRISDRDDLEFHEKNVQDKVDAQEQNSNLGNLLAPLGVIQKALFPPMARRSQAAMLSTAGVRLSPEVFLVLREILACILVVLTLIVLGKLSPFVFVAGALGFIAPQLWLKGKVNKYKLEVIRALPYVIDLLSLAVGAGLDFMLGIKWVVERTNMKNNVMVKELALLLREIKLGMSRKDALKKMSDRLDIPEVGSFVRTLIQADRMGTSMEENFRVLAEEIRRRRFQRGERMALRAPIKLLLPLIFCILPTVMVVVAGPVFLQFLKGGFAKF